MLLGGARPWEPSLGPGLLLLDPEDTQRFRQAESANGSLLQFEARA